MDKCLHLICACLLGKIATQKYDIVFKSSKGWIYSCLVGIILLLSGDCWFLKVSKFHNESMKSSFWYWYSFCGSYSIYELRNCHNAETIWKYSRFPLSKKNSFWRNYSRKYSIQYFWVFLLYCWGEFFCLYSSRTIAFLRKQVFFFSKNLLSWVRCLLVFKHFLILFWIALHRTKVRWRFRKILWPSQNIWTLYIYIDIFRPVSFGKIGKFENGMSFNSTL